MIGCWSTSRPAVGKIPPLAQEEPVQGMCQSQGHSIWHGFVDWTSPSAPTEILPGRVRLAMRSACYPPSGKKKWLWSSSSQFVGPNVRWMEFWWLVGWGGGRSLAWIHACRVLFVKLCNNGWCRWSSPREIASWASRHRSKAPPLQY